MIKVKFVPERQAIRVDINFHCKHQYLAEVIALFDALTKTDEDKELFMLALSDHLDKMKKEFENDKNNISNESDQ